MKEQQKVIEAQLVQLSNVSMSSPEILNALKAMQDGVVSKEMNQGTTATVFAAPSGIPDHIASGRK